MPKTDTFYMRISTQEKEMLARVAKKFHRSQADTIRTLIRDAHERTNIEKAGERKTPITHK